MRQHPLLSTLSEDCRETAACDRGNEKVNENTKSVKRKLRLPKNNSSFRVYIFILKHLVRANVRLVREPRFQVPLRRVRRRLRCLCLTWLPVREPAARSVA